MRILGFNAHQQSLDGKIWLLYTAYNSRVSYGHVNNANRKIRVGPRCVWGFSFSLKRSVTAATSAWQSNHREREWKTHHLSFFADNFKELIRYLKNPITDS